MASRRTARASAAAKVVEQLRSNRMQAVDAASRMGHAKLAKLMRRSQLMLEARLPRISPTADFTQAAQRQVLEQLRILSVAMRKGLSDATHDSAKGAAEAGAEAMVRFVVDAEKAYTGISMLGPRIQDVVQLDVAVAGADATVLRRVATDPSYRGSKAQAGVLERYGVATVNSFETTMQGMLMTGMSWGDARDSLVSDSAWLQGNPAFWAERILRTEVAAASNRSGHEVMRQMEVEAGETLRILVATFDDRTAADSYAVHGQVRRLEEPFDTWQGPAMVPPARPNDRETVVPHLREWPIPPELMPLPDSAVAARWAMETRSKKHPGGRPGMPPRPPLTTVLGFGGMPE